jgi:hypothetical protein
MEEWETPEFIKIRKKKTKRDSPYSEAEIWEQDELLTVIRHEPYIRNKAALALFWDFNARNHEVTKLKIKNIRLRERYGEGEVSYEAKTGSGPITCPQGRRCKRTLSLRRWPGQDAGMHQPEWPLYHGAWQRQSRA